MFCGVSIHAWITILTMLATFFVLLFTKLRSDVVFLAAAGLLMVTGVLSANEALSGFSSTAVAMVGLMFAVVAGLKYTGMLHWIVKHLLGWPGNYKKALVRVMALVAVLSPLMNKSTTVAMFVPIVKMWARKLNIAPSRLFLPVCLASNMGACCAFLVVPANLIVNSLYETNTGHSMSVLAPAIPAICALIAGMLTIIAMSRMLPDREAPEAAFESTGDYTVELLVPSDNPNIGKEVGALGLNKVRGGSLIELRHYDDYRITSPVPDSEPLMGGDRLIYAGLIDELLELKKTYGLVSADHHVFSYSEVNTARKLRTAYVSFGSSLIDAKIGEETFERDNNVTLVAVARSCKRIDQSPREVVLQAGDTLLLECPPHLKVNTSAMSQQLHFFDSADVPDIGRGTIVSAIIMTLMVLLSVGGILPLLHSAAIAAAAMLVFRCCTPAQAMNAVNWSLLTSLAGSISLGVAIQNTGVAAWISQSILEMNGGNPLAVMMAICLVASVITEFLSDTAVAAMTAPIMYSAATQLGCDPVPFLIALLMAVSSSFATPFGNMVNMLVYGPGGYRFSDFIRIGLPVKLVFLVVSIFMVYIVYPLNT